MSQPPTYNDCYPNDPNQYGNAAYPPPQSGFGYGNAYPPPQGAYPPPQGAYPPPQAAYPPRQPNYAYGEPKREEAVPKASDDVPMGSSFSDKAVRRGFIRKVYLILFSQLLVTFGFICLFIFVEPIKDWVQNDGLWFYICAYVLFIVLYIALICCPGVRKKSPGNYICLAVFTLAFSYLTGTISSFHNTNIVLLAAGITAAVCLAISLFAIQTKIDFTMCAGLLFVLCMVLIFFGITCMIVYLTWGYNYILDCVWGALAALVFGLFLIYDTQMVMGGRKYELSPEEYIYGALQLYIDVVQIFLIILGFMGKN